MTVEGPDGVKSWGVTCVTMTCPDTIFEGSTLPYLGLLESH